MGCALAKLHTQDQVTAKEQKTLGSLNGVVSSRALSSLHASRGSGQIWRLQIYCDNTVSLPLRMYRQSSSTGDSSP
eukprot:12887434-Prorocentrum_lima.AAC.1